MPKRDVRVLLHAHGPFRFALLQTEQPLDLLGLAEFDRRVKATDTRRFGELAAYVIEEIENLATQRAIISSPKRGLPRTEFEQLVEDTFPHDKMSMTWVTVSELDSVFSTQVAALLVRYAAM